MSFQLRTAASFSVLTMAAFALAYGGVLPAPANDKTGAAAIATAPAWVWLQDVLAAPPVL